MYIQTDNDNNIIELISVGEMPAENGYEIDENTVDREILDDILNYKYIDGEFIKNEHNPNSNIEMIKVAKISSLSNLCNSVITNGIDFNGEHFSLTSNDQINLMKLESSAKENPDMIIFYHADGQICRPFSTGDIIALAGLATQWILLNTTYFNLMKSQVQSMTSIDDIVAINYGSPLDQTLQETLDIISQNVPGMTIPVVEDPVDYTMPEIKFDIDALIEDKKHIDDIPINATTENTPDLGDDNETEEPTIDTEYDEIVDPEVPENNEPTGDGTESGDNSTDDGETIPEEDVVTEPSEEPVVTPDEDDIVSGEGVDDDATI